MAFLYRIARTSKPPCWNGLEVAKVAEEVVRGGLCRWSRLQEGSPHAWWLSLNLGAVQGILTITCDSNDLRSSGLYPLL